MAIIAPIVEMPFDLKVSTPDHLTNAKDTMDRTDWHILAELQADARLSFNELGRRVLLSAPAIADRVRRMVDGGVIAGYHAHVDPVRAGRSVRAFVRMQCYGPTCILRDPAVASWPEVVQLHRVTGVDCAVLLVAVPDMPAFQELLDRLADYGRPESSLILDDLVAWRPVQPVERP